MKGSDKPKLEPALILFYEQERDIDPRTGRGRVRPPRGHAAPPLGREPPPRRTTGACFLQLTPLKLNCKTYAYLQALAVVIMFLVTLAWWSDLVEAVNFLGSKDGWLGFLIIVVGAGTAFFYNLSVYYFTRWVLIQPHPDRIQPRPHFIRNPSRYVLLSP